MIAALDAPPTLKTESESLADARAASQAKRWQEAAALWREMTQRAPGTESNWDQAAIALRQIPRFAEAEALLAEAQAHFPDSARLSSLRAWNAAALRDVELSERLWHAHRSSFPQDPMGDVGLAFILRAQGRADELELLLKDALTRFPDRRDLRLLVAAVPSIRRQWPEAAAEYRILQKLYPQDETIALGLAEALRNLQQFDEADQVLAEGSKAFPNSFELATAFARLPGQRRDWFTAITRWDDLLKRFPDKLAVHTGMSSALRSAGLAALHAHFFQATLAKFPDDDGLACEPVSAKIYQRDCSWPEVRAEAETLIARFPNSERVLALYTFILVGAGEPDRAEALLQDAILRFPGNFEMRMTLARAAAARSEWPQAVSRWEALLEKRPTDQIIITELGRARYNLSLHDTPPATSGRNEAEDVRLVNAFQSLGEDCEFGLLQRELGAEPLGLLRFAGTSPKNLIEVLNCRFKGVGTRKFLQLRVERDEYIATDARFGMSMHTHINPRTAEHDATYETMLKKTSYLRRELIDDLEAADKIFVYKDRGGQTLPNLPAFRAALDQYGPVRLFVVTLATPDHPRGSVEAVDDRTLIGYIERHGRDDSGWNVPVASWLNLCRAACRHWSVNY